MTGWIKLHRSLIEWEWWEDHNATRLLIYLLCSVNHDQKRWKGIVVNPGTIITSFPKLSHATGMSVKAVRIALEKLEESGEVTRKKAREGQAVTLIKWDKMQVKRKKGAGKGADDGQGNGTKGATTKEGKEGNNNKKEEISFETVWNLYDKKVGDKEKIKIKWDALDFEVQKIAVDHIPLYKKSQPDKKYRKHFMTYLNQKSYYDEIINSNGQGNGGTKAGTHRIGTNFDQGL